MNELIDNVRQWFHKKGIIANSNPLKQLEKTQEELTETRDAAVRLGCTRFYANQLTPELYEDQRKLYLNELKDGIGDTVVTLIGVCEMYGLSLEECLQQAYDVISKRTGKMVDGKFVKENVDSTTFLN